MEEGISECEGISKETSKTRKQKEQRLEGKKKNNNKDRDNYKKYSMYVMGIPKGEEK